MLEYFNLFFSDTEDAFFVIDATKEVVVSCNFKALDLFGYTEKDDVINKPFSAIYPDFSKEKEDNFIFKYNHVLTTEKRYARLVRSFFLHDKNKFCLLRVEDVSKEQVHNGDVDRLEKIIKTIPDLFYIIDRDGYYREFYSLDKKAFLSKDERIIGKNIADRNLPKKVEIRILANLERGLETRKPQLFYYNLEVDKEQVGFEARLIPLDDHEALIIIRDISAFNRSQSALREVNERLTKVLNSINHIIFDIKIEKNGSHIFQYISPQIEKVYGYTIAEYKKIIKDQRKKELIHPDDIHIIEKSARTLSEMKQPITQTYRLKPKGRDDYIFIQEDVFPEINEKGKYVGNFGVAKDVTQKVMAERQLQERERILSTLFSHLPGMAYRCLPDKNWTMKVVSQGCVGITGYDRTEIINNKVTSYRSLIHPDFNNVTPEEMLDDVNQSGTFSFEYKIIAKDGSERWVWDQGEVIKDEEGKVIAFEGYIADLTERKDSEKQKIRAELAEEANKNLAKEIKKRISAQEELAKTQEFTNSIIHSSIDMIMASDRNGKITQISPSVMKAFGYTEKEILGKKGVKLFNQANSHEDVLQELKAKGEFTGEVENISKSGKVFISYLSASILKDSKGNEIGSMGVSRDITEFKKAEWKLKESIAEKDVLLKEVHHRVKNNLQVISSILNLQTSYIKDNKTLEIIRESQNRIKSMSFIHESLYQTTNFSSIKFYEYIEKLSRNLVQTYAYEKNIKLETDLEQVDVSLDQAIPCGLILNELISNALKYAFVGDKNDGTLKIMLSEKGEEIFITVEDNGVGIPGELDVENTDSLGLQLVFTLIEQLEGTINLDTKTGTKYLITFAKQP